jgi:outer membrane lipoprotein SlyB
MKKQIRGIKYTLIIPVAMLVVSCAQTSNTSDTYQRGQAGQVESLQTGRVISIDRVKLEGGTEAGTMFGAIAGGLLGSQIGSGRTSQIAGATGGALVGGAAGSRVGQAMGSKPGLRIGVKLDEGGGSFTVVQEVNPRESFYVGDRVRVLGSGNSAKVTH